MRLVGQETLSFQSHTRRYVATRMILTVIIQLFLVSRLYRSIGSNSNSSRASSSALVFCLCFQRTQNAKAKPAIKNPLFIDVRLFMVVRNCCGNKPPRKSANEKISKLLISPWTSPGSSVQHKKITCKRVRCKGLLWKSAKIAIRYFECDALG